MTILSLDLSTKATGYAIFTDGKLYKSGVYRSSSATLIKRINIIINKLNEEILQYIDIDKIIAEEVLPESSGGGNQKTFKALMYMQAALELKVYDVFDTKVPIEYIYPNSWRSKCGIKTGRGITRDELKKADIEFAATTYNLSNLSDDEADAIGIGHSYFIKDEKKNNEFCW